MKEILLRGLETLKLVPPFMSLSTLSPPLLSLLSSFLSSSSLPSLSFSLFLQSTSLFLSPSHTTTPQTLFRCASITKSFTCLGLLRILKKLKIGLEENLIDLLPELEGKIKGGKMPIRAILGHCAGLPCEGGFDRWDGEEMLDKSLILENLNIDSIGEPYEKFHYSNVGYILLGLLIEKLTGLTYEEFMTNEILLPFQMNDSTFTFNQPKNQEIEPIGHLFIEEEKLNIAAPIVGYGGCKSCGGLLTNIADLSKYIEKMNKNLEFIEMKSPISMIKNNKVNNFKLKSRAYGMGIIIGDYDDKYVTYSHSGGTWGFTSYYIIIPEFNLSFILWYPSNALGLMKICNKILDFVISFLESEQDMKKTSILTQKREYKKYYAHKMGNRICVRYPTLSDLELKTEAFLNIDLYAKNGSREKKIRVRLINGEKIIYKLEEGSDVDELIQLHFDEESNFAHKLTFKGGLYVLEENNL